MSVLTVRVLPGRALGMVTLGAWPKAPVAVTAVFAPVPLTLPVDAEAEADAEEAEEEADDFDDTAAREDHASQQGNGEER